LPLAVLRESISHIVDRPVSFSFTCRTFIRPITTAHLSLKPITLWKLEIICALVRFEQEKVQLLGHSAEIITYQAHQVVQGQHKHANQCNCLHRSDDPRVPITELPYVSTIPPIRSLCTSSNFFMILIRRALIFVQFGFDIGLSAFRALLLCVHRPPRLDTDLPCQGIVSHHCFRENELNVIAIMDIGDVCRYGYNNGTTQT
jgi:hypothetical protein